MNDNNKCPYCSRPDVGSFSPVSLNNRSFVDEESSLYQRLDQVQSLMGQLLIEKHKLLLRLNSIRSATRNVPSEVLSLIFEEACRGPAQVREEQTEEMPLEEPPMPLKDAGAIKSILLRLGKVSSRWRSVIHSTPRLWAVWSLWLDPYDFKYRVAMMTEYIRLSKNLPLTITLNFDFSEVDEPGDEDWTVPSTLKSALWENRSRVRTLHLCDPPRYWVQRISTFSSLRELSLDYSDLSSLTAGQISMTDCPHLVKLTLIDCREWMGLHTPPSTALTHVSLLKVHVSLAITILLRSPLLIDFQCLTLDWSPEQFSPPDMTKPVLLEHLQKLAWDISGIDDRRESIELHHGLLRALHLPALKSLLWKTSKNAEADPGYHPLLKTFFSRLISLKSLVIERTDYLPFRTEYQASMLPSQVELIVLRSWFPSRLFDFVKSEVLVDSEGQQVGCPLPHLRRLSIYRLRQGPTPDQLGSMITNLLERRPNPLTVSLDVASTSEFISGLGERLRHLEGLEGRFEFTHYGKKVDYHQR
ncbi:hypothetical protein NP233_g5920 [Leucocoprinus birnbaumii]|uniref:F-box domain-containing protein n=1 Tax=Leucocoprinus birnbaumii TaxID=56174 RepID=A0AAD5VUN1_9AGAR|nr:hypothetical protein NP233_g5920 [Leucocoprinus birnbaumii]